MLSYTTQTSKVNGFGDQRERDHLEDLCVDGRIILKWNFKKQDWQAAPGLTWLRIGTGGERL